MPRNRVVAIPLLAILLAMLPFASLPMVSETLDSSLPTNSDSQRTLSQFSDIHSGTLDPVLIEHTGASSGMTTSGSSRMDIDPNPSTEVYLPVSAPDNYYSGEGEGGYYLVGSGGAADFGSPAGTISFWGKWDGTAPHGRFWGQDANFETRWSSNQFVLDWGSDSTAQGSKSSWLVDHWYFIAITWNETANYLAIFWGDETNSPAIDFSSFGWTDSVVGFHTENNILNSIARAGQQVDGHIDDFRYYISDRNLTEIQSDYLPGSTITESSLTNHYEFENDLTDSVGDLDLQVSGTCSISRDVPRSLHGWYGDKIKVTANDIRKLYALNGTFESGNPGTNEDWAGDGAYYADGWLARREVNSLFGRQRASYVQDIDSYVILENEGFYDGSNFRHYNGTRIFWYQDIDNSEQTELFYFNLDYNYMRGPIGTNFEGIFELRFEILDDSTQLWNWSIDLTNVTQRQTWFSNGQLLVNLTGAPTFFTARIILEVETVATYVAISETDSDLDGDATNGQFVTVYLNNLELRSANTFSSGSVQLTVSSQETGTINISDTGVAFLNHSEWVYPIVPLEFGSNATIVFDYSAEFSMMHRSFSSSATTSLGNLGVTFSVDLDASINISFYTYVESSPEAKDLGFRLFCPDDWENASVEDPFGTPVSVDESDMIIVPAGEVDSVGWWKVDISAPNYAKSVSTMVEDASEWFTEDIFRSNNKIRCLAEIGTQTNTVTSVTNLEMKWYLPSETLWASETLDNATGSIVIGSAWTLGSFNSTTGSWLVSVYWINGTEVAFGSTEFELHHELTMIAHTPSIDVQLGDVFTVAVNLYDLDTYTPIMNDATIVGNWSTSNVEFHPNLAKGWWEADVNSSITGTGRYSMTVNATVPFHFATNCTVEVEITSLSIMTVLGNQIVELDPDESRQIKVRYMYLDALGIEDANVSILSINGPSEGLLYSNPQFVIGEPGNYSVDFTAVLSGTYFITMSATKVGHSTAATSFYIIVGLVPASVRIEGADLPDELHFNQSYVISLFYHTNDTFGIENAIVNVTYNPASIVSWSEIGNGSYNVSIRVPQVGTYAVGLRFSKLGFDFVYIEFNFEVVKIPTSLSFYGLNGVYYEGRTYDFAIYYNSTDETGVLSAELIPSAPIRDFFVLSNTGSGWYNFTLTPTFGIWNATIWLSKEGFVEQSVRFTLTTEMIPIEISPYHHLNSTYTRYVSTILTLRFVPLSGDTGLPIENALVSYILIDAGGTGDTILTQGYFVQSLGFYIANITVPDIGLYLIRLTVTKEHHQSFVQEIVLNAVARPGTIYGSYLRAGAIGALLLLACIASIMIGKRFYTNLTTKRNLELLDLKGRLEDAKNLIGLLVIQRKVGLSVYSKIIKGGFEESLLSSFIAAISQFREEFSMDSPKWTSIPITEVITAVQSEELICVIITLESASARQKIQLETFAREVGGLYDYDDKIVTPIYRTLTEDVVETFNKVFDSYFDGQLFERYVGVKKNLPEALAPVASAFKTMKIDHGVSPDAIIKELSLLGFSERISHRIVFEALDNGYFIAAEKRLPQLLKEEETP
ncbi:MAG: hypothetical protein ACFFE2_10775 [Candidatus Thorarchaeota archaeon]